MIFWSLCAFIWFRNMKKMLLQMTSVFLQLESTIGKCCNNFNLPDEVIKVFGTKEVYTNSNNDCDDDCDVD
jgi:hypothetical protein